MSGRYLTVLSQRSAYRAPSTAVSTCTTVADGPWGSLGEAAGPGRECDDRPATRPAPEELDPQRNNWVEPVRIDHRAPRAAVPNGRAVGPVDSLRFSIASVQLRDGEHRAAPDPAVTTS